VRRREFILLLGSAMAWPAKAHSQGPVSIVGFLSSRSPEESEHLVAAFPKGLGNKGFVEGKNVVIEYRWAQGRYDQLPALAAELVNRAVSVIFTAGGPPSDWRQRQPHRQSPLYSPPPMTPFTWAWLSALPSLAAMSPE
jgi:putative ABC transport system substrate-binding protein